MIAVGGKGQHAKRRADVRARMGMTSQTQEIPANRT